MNTAKLLALADKLDATTQKYDQLSYMFCAVAHHFDSVGKADMPIVNNLHRIERFLGQEFDITCAQANELFGSAGCGRAGTDARAAAAYIRNFVAVGHQQYESVAA